MAVGAYFHPKGMTLAQFNEIHRLLDEAGAGGVAGMIHHSCFGDDGDLMVYDVWESQEAFEEFGKVLMPIIAKVGVDVGEPAMMTVHRIDQVGEVHIS